MNPYRTLVINSVESSSYNFLDLRLYEFFVIGAGPRKGKRSKIIGNIWEKSGGVTADMENYLRSKS